MKILFIGARLFDDVAFYIEDKNITSILTESNENSPNLQLSNKYYIVPRGMEKPMDIAISNGVDAVVPLIGIDPPLKDVAIMKEKLESEYNIPVIASNSFAVNISSDKIKTKEFFNSISVNTPKYFVFRKNEGFNDNTFDYPLVLKQSEGQGGKNIVIANNCTEFRKYADNFNQVLCEEFIEGSEISIEVLCWNNKFFPLVPVYKGETTLECIHPLNKVKSAPCEITNLDNNKIKETAIKIAKNLKCEGTIDIDFIYSKKKDKLHAIEINTRPSGTRYLSTASTSISPLIQLINMATNDFNLKALKNQIKDYYGLEIPVGDYKGSFPDKGLKRFEKNSWLVHGPKGYERITISGETKEKAYSLFDKLIS
jgi:carbamoylphosphate synthase large subunit